VLGQHLVRYGVMGVVERFAAVDGSRYARGTRVICRTPRGTETGEVLGPANSDLGGASSLSAVRGQILRRIGVEDDLLISRLSSRRDQAFADCQTLLQLRRIDATLIDVEQLFDGETLLFYFLGETSPELDAITAELRETYSTAVEFRQFADTLEHGCGPGCGTEAAAGNGCGTSGGCSTCAVVAACGAKHGH
jgi:cell fate regulator YaaT (PSP1 superfamily)